MNKVTALIVVTYLANMSSDAYADPRPPEIIKISISREPDLTGFRGIKAFFQWLGDAPDFGSNQAVEFEVIIVTDKPKCFGQPPAGKDNNVFHAQSNLPDFYTDVWNFYWPSDPDEVIADLRANCGGLTGWCQSGIQLYNPDLSDYHANFAVGSRRPDLIQANTTYLFLYPLETPSDPECLEYDNGLAWVQINMTIIPNTCTKCGSVRTCPHFLGAPDCPEYKIFRETVDEGEDCKSIIKRLCAPTIEYTFSPYDIGFSDIQCGSGEEGGGACIDEDGDGFFALFQNSSGSWIPMFGTNVGDCNDNADNIDNNNYDQTSGTCSTLIDPPIDPCSTTTSGNGYYCGQNQEIHEGNYGELYYCYNGMASTPPQGSPPIGPCPDNNCIVETGGIDDHCYEPGCTQICSTNQTQCTGNDVEICSQDQCSFVYDHACGSSQACLNGQCITQPDPPPVITSVSCTNTMRGESATCTIYGNNFNCDSGSNTYIAGLFGGHTPCSSTQITISGIWDCIEPLGLKQVSHKNPDNQRDDTFNLVNLIMGELQITDVWQQTVHEGDTNVPMGANGCNFGQNVVFYAEFIDVGQTAYLSAQNQVLATGNVTGTTANSPVDVCIAKFPNATDSFDKKCWNNYVNIIP